MLPQLSPALHQLWRDEHTVQLGVHPGRAIVLRGLDAGASRVMAALDGRHSVQDISAIAQQHNITEARLSELLQTLSAAGVLLNAQRNFPDRMPLSARAQLQPDMAALTLTHGEHATTVLERRASRSVVIYGNGRVAPVIAATLASSGIGRIHVHGRATARTTDACVGGIIPSDERRSYATAAHDAIHRAMANVDTRAPRSSRPPSFIVLARGTVCGEVETPSFAHRGVPHLPVLLREGTVIVGPLIIPGKSACLRCLDLHRRDRDPAWPALASQLATGAERADVSHTALVVAAAGLASAQILAFFDGSPPTTLGACLELDGLGNGVRRRSWSPHPQCGCAKLPIQKGSGGPSARLRQTRTN